MTMTSDLRDQALRVAGVLEPETMSGEQALAAVEDLATVEKAASGALLFAALRVARSSAWKGRGFATAADWLAGVLGVSVREAAAHLGTAKKADRLPKTKKAMKQGDLSPDQAGAVTDGADADPDAEDDLLDSAARDTNKALKDKAAKAKAAATDSAARERRIRSRRSLRRGTDAEGAFWVRLYGPGVDAAAFEAMFRPFEELLFRHGRSTGVRDTFENRSYDAFLAMLAHHTHLATQTANGAAGASQDPAPEEEPEPAPPVKPDHGGADHRPQPGRAGPTDGSGPADDAPGGGDPSGSDSHDADRSAGGERDGDADHEPGRDTDTDRGIDAQSEPGGETDIKTGRGADVEPAASDPSAPGTGSGPPGPGGSPPSPRDGAATRSGGAAPPAWRPPWDPDRSVPLPAKLPGGNNVKVIVLVDHQALLRGHTLAGETCEIAGVGPVSVTAVRQILRNDPFLAVAIRNGRDIVNVAHHGRGLNAHQRTAIEAAGLRCTNQACNQTIAIEIDHRVGYATNDQTKLDNQDPLCGGCHRLKTHHGHHLEPGTGPRRLLPPGHPDNPLTPHQGEDTAPGPGAGRTARATTDPATGSRRDQVEQPTLC